MRRLKLFVATSLDGFIAGPHEEIDWLFMDQDYGMAEFYKTVDTVLLGRKTVELGERLGQTHYAGMRNYFFSRTPRESDIPEVEWVSSNAVDFVRGLKAEEGKDIWLVGGSELFASLLEEQLVDDIMLAVHPIVLGSGISLYKTTLERVALELTDLKEYDTGLVTLSYAVRPPNG